MFVGKKKKIIIIKQKDTIELHLNESALRIQTCQRGKVARREVQVKRSAANRQETTVPAAVVQQVNDEPTAVKSPRLQAVDILKKPVPYRQSSYLKNDVSNVLIRDSDIRCLFDKYDKDGSGCLSRGEVKEIYNSFENYGLEEGSSKVDEILSKYGFLSDGKVSYDEFAILMLSLAQR